MANHKHLEILQRGIDVWNKWRENNPGIKPNLEAANLYKVNLSGINLSDSDLSEADLSEADLSRANLSGAFLLNTELLGVNLSGADLSGMYFPNTNLSGANLSGANLLKAELFGVNLSDANLSGANLSGVNLSSTKLLGANLSRTNLSRTNLLGTNLSRTNLLGANLSETKLLGANLSGMNLSETNFSGANLSEANLSGINLELSSLISAKLIKVNLLNAKLLNANLTGAYLNDACIKDWHINENTKLDNVVCDCIFLGYDDETKQPKDRRPASGSFAPGEFAVLFQRIQETIDLVFLTGIDWKAFAASFFNVQSESGGGELSIQAIEKKKDGAFVIRVTVPEGADKADIEKQLKEKYEWQLKALTEQYQFQLHAKENEIAIYRQQSANFFQIIEWLSKRPTIIENKVESNLMSGNQEFNFPDAQIAGGAFGSHGGTHTGGTINNYGQQQDLAAAAAEIQKILDQLSQQYPTTTIVEQAIVAEKAVQQVAANPQLQSRVIGAIKAVGTEVFKQAVNHPAVSIFLEGVKGWSEAK